LARLKQGSSLVDYLEKFDNLLARVMVSEDILLNLFLSGLNLELEKSVRLHKPSTIQEAVRLATGRGVPRVGQENARHFRSKL